MPVFLTGGSGVVGAAVLRHLVNAGEEVRALSRSGSSDQGIERLGGTPVRGDVFSDLSGAMAGCEVVYHVAGVNEMCSTDSSAMTMVNVDGSLSVLRSADRAGIPRMVYTSSAAALGEVGGTVGSESSPHRGHYLSRYERSKHLAELAILAEGTDVEVISVNPSSVQGPGRATGTGKLILDLVRGRLPALVDTSLSIVAIDDCARGHLLAAEHGRAGERYVLNSFSIDMREAVGLLEACLGRRVRVRYIPGTMAQMAAASVEWVFRMVRRRPPLCREMVGTMLHGHRYDGTKAERELGLSYTSAPDLLAGLVDWYRQEGLIDD